MDHSRNAIQEAQRIANFFVDEARLSGNKFSNKERDQKFLISNYDINVIERDMESGDINEVKEMYLFE
jgi:hypothetical protein